MTTPPPVEYERVHPDVDPKGWVRIRWKEDGRKPERAFPKVCVNCLSATEGRRCYVSNSHDLCVGLCESCAEYWSRRRGRIGVVGAMLVLLLAGGCFALLIHVSRSWLGVIEGTLIAIGLAGGVIYFVARHFAEPIEFYGLPINATWIRFRNRAFTNIYLGLPLAESYGRHRRTADDAP